MDLLLLTHRPDGYTARRLVTAGARAGHRVRTLAPDRLGAHGPLVRLLGTGAADSVHLRVSSDGVGHALAVLGALEAAGVHAWGRSAELWTAVGRARVMVALSAARVPVTPWWIPRRAGVDPGPAGRGPWAVHLDGLLGPTARVTARSARARDAAVAVFQKLGHPVLVQALPGQAWRALVVAGRVVAWTRQGRVGQPAGTHAARVARAAARVLGLEVLGVDVRVTGGNAVVEGVTASPALEAAERAGGLDVASLVVKAWVRAARRQRAG